MLHRHILSIFNRLRVTRSFHFGWDFPTAGQICGVFGEDDPQKVNTLKKTLAWRALPYVKPRLLSYREWKLVHGYGLYAWQGKKKQKTKK